MENNALISNTYFNNDNIYKTDYNVGSSFYKESGLRTANFILTAEGGNNFFHYLKSFNLFKEQGLMLLPPDHHYYYDEDDLKNVRTLINVKRLNLTKNLEIFLHSLYRILPPNVNFIGCFSDSKTLNQNGFFSKLSERFNNLLDSRTDRDIDKKYVSQLLEMYGFKIIDMTEMNGLTYFYSQNNLHNLEIRA